MIPEALVLATALQSHALWMGDRRAEYLASAVLYAAGEDVEEQAAFIVILVREGGTSRLVEECGVPGIGGWGAFGLNSNTVPFETSCGPIGGQARATHGVLARKGFDPDDTLPGWRGYLGAHSINHPEVQARGAMFHQVRWEQENLACF